MVASPVPWISSEMSEKLPLSISTVTVLVASSAGVALVVVVCETVNPCGSDTIKKVSSLVLFHAPALKVSVACPLTLKDGEVMLPLVPDLPTLMHWSAS